MEERVEEIMQNTAQRDEDIKIKSKKCELYRENNFSKIIKNTNSQNQKVKWKANRINK